MLAVVPGGSDAFRARAAMCYICATINPATRRRAGKTRVELAAAGVLECSKLSKRAVG